MIPSDDVLMPDPILAMADISPAWGGGAAGHMAGMSYNSASNYPMMVPRPHPARESHDRFRQDSMGESLDSISCGSGEYDHLSPSPEDHTHNHAHYPHYSAQDDMYSSGSLYEYNGGRGRDDYELVGPPERAPPTPSSHTSSNSQLSTMTGRSTALPPFSDHTPSSTPSTLGGRGSQYDTDEELTELQRAGLELARAGLELAGYKEGPGEPETEEEGEDKEWQQWRNIKQDEQG